jgi:hypothetical protein
MPSPIVVRISHALGKAEATRRIEDGFGKANAILPNVVRIEESGGGDRPLSLAVHALGQSVTAAITVENEYVIVEASVPTFLAPFANKAKSFTQSFGTKLLTGPPPK